MTAHAPEVSSARFRTREREKEQQERRFNPLAFNCPGTTSEQAGKSSACQGCPNQTICASGATKAPDPAIEEIQLKMATVKHKILVLSGKGGVGKSTFSAHLAHALAADDSKERLRCFRKQPVDVHSTIWSQDGEESVGVLSPSRRHHGMGLELDVSCGLKLEVSCGTASGGQRPQDDQLEDDQHCTAAADELSSLTVHLQGGAARTSSSTCPVQSQLLLVLVEGLHGVRYVSFTVYNAFPSSFQVALLDIDICGPSIPKIMGLEGEQDDRPHRGSSNLALCFSVQVHQSGSGWSPVYVEDNLAVMSIGFLLGSPDDAVIWRGPKKNGMIKQFLRDVDWGELDYLIVDTPPGTSDEHLSVVQYLSGAGIDGAVIITTPQLAPLIQPHTTTHPPPWLTVGKTHSSLCSSPGCPHTRLTPSEPNVSRCRAECLPLPGRVSPVAGPSVSRCGC
ncbi:hypothetical protein NFI96_024129 [Prochilodus magdalenae]|nr:hypothetical protein NFI96_024129 [Prochilodus magdalenae]